ncbi:MAG: tRNA (adenosine(37)-N6)-threonylcarbamoyltransferase complex ATPase subunit type 1 TsaE [Steroidobacteraceae bacterium]
MSAPATRLSRRWPLADAAQTQQLGAALARACPWPAAEALLLFLSGELGAGKTTLAAALLDALGVPETIRSPSFSLIEIYALRSGVAVHVDCYRLADARELEQLGLREYFTANTLMLIEWPEQAASALPQPDLALHLAFAGAGRICTVSARSSAGESWLGQLEQQLIMSDVNRD